MTDMGYTFLVDAIINRAVEPPQGFTSDQLCAWLTGYAKCQNDILELIDKFRKGQKE